MKKVVYIISEYFAPFEEQASERSTKIAKYLSMREDYYVIVFTRRNFDKVDPMLKKDLEIIQKRGKVFYIDVSKRHYRTSKIRELMEVVLYKICPNLYINSFLFMIDGIRFSKKGFQIIQKENKKIPKPDYIFSTYRQWGGHYLAAKIKKIYGKKVYWIADFRDVVEYNVRRGFFRKVCDKYKDYIFRESDCISAISDGLIKNLSVPADKRHFIATNGFDYDDYNYVLSSSKLRFTYTGSYYSGSLERLFDAFSELIFEHKLNEDDIEFNYAGGYGHILRSQLKSRNLESILNDWGQLRRYQCIQIQNNSDVLVGSASNNEDLEGVLPAKVLSYLALKKPIINIICGQLRNSELKIRMNEIKCGLCYETNFDELQDLKDYIYELYQKKINKECLIKYDENALSKYELKNITQIFYKNMK